jgi:hypothetical protein
VPKERISLIMTKEETSFWNCASCGHPISVDEEFHQLSYLAPNGVIIEGAAMLCGECVKPFREEIAAQLQNVIKL